MRIGIDAGGTFTDFVIAHKDGRIQTFKLRSNPRAPARVVLAGLKDAAGRAELVHGSTVATNALLERKGARTALVTTAGFEDVIHIGRQNRARLYDLNPPPRRPLVPRDRCFGIAERTFCDGIVGERPPARQLQALRGRLEKLGVESVAICFLHSYANPENERAVLGALRAAFVCASHEVCPEFREYERTSTTVLNAYVGPLIDRYLGELESGGRRISIMQSNGGVMSTAEARRNAVRTLLSGPAGGVAGAVGTARLSGIEKVLAFDMGGTSTDVSLSDGAPRQTMEAAIDGFPVRVPMLDIETVGAGGGSIARVDEGGMLRVGPESAGADPGPACYGAGDLPAVTDAHVLLGRIAAGQFLGGAMRIYPERAAAAISRLAAALRLDPVAAAESIVRVANANMERAIRAVSVERGYDPRDFTLLAFGGCGGLHACDMAEDLGIRSIAVPEHAGVLSALGMLMADRLRDYAAGVLGRDDIEAQFRALERRARRDLPRAALARYADLRYAGQSYELTIPWGASFHAEHQRLYGYADPGRATEIVAVRLRALEEVPKLELGRPRPATSRPSGERRLRLDGRWRKLPVLLRTEVGTRTARGPALILDYGATTLVKPEWTCRIDRIGALLLSRR